MLSAPLVLTLTYNLKYVCLAKLEENLKKKVLVLVKHAQKEHILFPGLLFVLIAQKELIQKRVLLIVKLVPKEK